MMDDLEKVICLLENENCKTNDIELKLQITRAISLIYQGLKFEESHKDYMASQNVLMQLNKISPLKKDEKFNFDVPF